MLSRFHVSLALCTTACAAFAIHAMTQATPGESTVELPVHMTRLAFGTDAWPEPEEPGCFEEIVLEPVPSSRTVHLADAAFVGAGDWELGVTLVRRRVGDLKVCYDEDAAETVEITLETWADPVVSGVSPERAACLTERLGDWPWPQDLAGRMVLSLRAGTLI